MIDIDKFKSINDNYGHQVGDDVIVHFATTLKSIQRKSDVSCRYGGEEFVLLLPNTNITGAQNLANKIRLQIEATRLTLPSKEQIQFTVSLGVAIVNFENDTNIEAALKRADKAMYEAKNSGRNKVCLS